MANFAHTHTHSHYSLRDAVTKVPELVARVKELGMDAIALTEHGTLASAFELDKEAKRHEIKPIFGVEAYMAPRTRFDKDKDLDGGYYHVILLAMNQEGWRNILQLVTESNYKESTYFKPRIDKELLRQHNEGIICTSACLAGEVQRAILKEVQFSYDGEDKAANVGNVAEVLEWYKDVFGDRFYLELMNHGIPAEQAVIYYVINNYSKLGVKVIATNDAHYLKSEDKILHDIMFAIRDKKSIYDEDKYSYHGDGFYIKSEAEMLESFDFFPEAVYNTMEIVERCNVDITSSGYKLPHIVDIRQEDDILREKAYEGLTEKMGNIPDNYKERLEEELKTFRQMGFSSYFLMVSDYIRWTKSQGILVGPARGSAAGSLVAWAIDITTVDPIKYDLLFARFLNKGRAAVPDIEFDEAPIQTIMEAQ